MSNIYDKASLVLIPSGTKTSKVFSQKPVNGDGDFTFSRSTAATRVNADGNIEKETQNLLLQSNTFSNATWTKSNSNVTSGQSGYDGTNDAWKLQSTTTGGAQLRQDVVDSGVQTFSIYAKAGNVNYMYFRIGGTTNQGAFIDLGDGSVLSYFNQSDIIGDVVINSVGGDWYRISIACNTTTSDIRFYVSDSGGTTSAIGSFIYIQDAQLEQGLVARDYIETTTAAVEGGITDNVPRLDYTDSSCPALLLEPQRTNLIDYSEYYDSWLKAGTTPTFTENYGTSLEGLQNSTRVQLDNNELFYRTPNAAQGAYVFSVFAKDISGGGSKITLRIDVPATKVATFDLSDGSIDTYTSDNALIEDYGNGWYRCMLIQNNDAILNAVIAEGDNGLDCEIYGAQLEAGSYATSYIPTYGTSVTRNDDMAQITPLSTDILDTSLAHTGFIEIKANAKGGAGYQVLGIDNGFYSNFIKLYIDSSLAKLRLGYRDSSGNVNYSDFGNVGDYSKFAWTYDGVGEFKFYVDGVLTSTHSAVMNSFSNFGYGDKSGQTNYANTSTKQILLFPTALSNEEAIALTTI